MPAKLLWKHQSEELVIFFRSKRNFKSEGLNSLFSETEITDIKCFVCFIVRQTFIVCYKSFEKGKKKVCSTFLLVEMNYHVASVTNSFSHFLLPACLPHHMGHKCLPSVTLIETPWS